MATEKQAEIKILTESQIFPRTMLFNRVGTERLGSTLIFYFGLSDDDDNLRDAYACAVDEETIERHKEEILSYVARASTDAPAELPAWRPKSSAVSRIDVANVMRVARIGGFAELRFYNFSIGDVLESRETGKTSVSSAPVSLLRCGLELQRSLFLSLYSESLETKNAKK